jgi:hypothetical protein
MTRCGTYGGEQAAAAGLSTFVCVGSSNGGLDKSLPCRTTASGDVRVDDDRVMDGATGPSFTCNTKPGCPHAKSTVFERMPAE